MHIYIFISYSTPTPNQLVTRTAVVRLSLNRAFVNEGLGVTIPSQLVGNRLAFHNYPSNSATVNRNPVAGKKGERGRAREI